MNIKLKGVDFVLHSTDLSYSFLTKQLEYLVGEERKDAWSYIEELLDKNSLNRVFKAQFTSFSDGRTFLEFSVVGTTPVTFRSET